ncbi:MAG: helix-turn-helix domain-containing protein [DPANN group archaeon]|nr:helix-turn-helix domain-containing protein [DPANN group archaeon]
MLPCEKAAKYKVPAIKARLAKNLKNKGYPQKQIADFLNVTEAAVSQYLSGKRAVKQEKDVKTKQVPEVCKHCGMCKLK